MKYIALDIGGTAIKYGILDAEGNVEFNSQVETNAALGRDSLLSKIKSVIHELVGRGSKDDYAGIAISTAGQVNYETGVITYASENIPGWTGTRVKELLEQEFGMPCFVENDVNCAALGEMWKGAARGEKNFLCLTLGTGVGGAIVMDGRVVHGASNSAGEFGHMTIEKDGRKCNCGYKGCYERYASMTALVASAREALHDDSVNGKDVFDAARAGDETCLGLIDNWTHDVAVGLRNLVHIFNPSMIIIGGQVSLQKDFLTSRIEKHLQEMLMSSYQDVLTIKTAQCGNMAGMLGAAYGLMAVL